MPPHDPNDQPGTFIDGSSESTESDEIVTLLNPATENSDPAPPTPTSGSPLIHPMWGHSTSAPNTPLMPTHHAAAVDVDENADNASESTDRPPSIASNKKFIRWVGVNGSHRHSGTGSVGNGSAPPGSVHTPLLSSPTTPGTPHIIVSGDEPPEFPTEDISDPNTNTEIEEQGENGGTNASPSTQPLMDSNSGVYPNLGQDARRLSGSIRGDRSMGMTLEPTDYRLPVEMRKTRRNSMLELLRRTNSTTNLQHGNSTSNIRRANSRNSLCPSENWRTEGKSKEEQCDSLIICLSALYGKLLVVMGMAFPMAEVISSEMPSAFYNGFYLYLYFGSILFLLYVYLFLLRTSSLPTLGVRTKIQTIKSYMPLELNWKHLFRRSSDDDKGRVPRERKDTDPERGDDRTSMNTAIYKSSKYTLTESRNHGSMYLKMGAVVFGIGSMIYSGLEVGQYFELKNDAECNDILLVISPASRMMFTFIQMYFIFLNSRVAISRHCIISRFGLMHMIGTNLCVWLNVLVQETKHEIAGLIYGDHGHHGHNGGDTPATAVYKEHGSGSDGLYFSEEKHIVDDSDTITSEVLNLVNNTVNAIITGSAETMVEDTSFDYPDLSFVSNSTDLHHIVKRSSHQDMVECRRWNLMGRLVDQASPFLFPCTIEYSLLCCGVLYVIWKNINKPIMNTFDADSDISTYIARKTKHHYSVDCAHANRGLFMGILALVLTVISLILFFVLITDERLKEVAILEANIMELVIYSMSIVTVVVGMVQMRKLEFVPEGDIELDNILLLIAQTGVYIYTSFTIIGGNFTLEDNLILPLMTAIITLTQTTLQTIFILDASRRCCYTQEQLDTKPGREMVTFLLVCNLAMWAINTFETSRADAHPVQLHFYGVWAWTIISHISMPLAIFYRFHVTVCLCEIWKRAYKLKNDYL